MHRGYAHRVRLKVPIRHVDHLSMPLMVRLSLAGADRNPTAETVDESASAHRRRTDSSHPVLGEQLPVDEVRQVLAHSVRVCLKEVTGTLDVPFRVEAQEDAVEVSAPLHCVFAGWGLCLRYIYHREQQLTLER